jgi:hypothetical protein
VDRKIARFFAPEDAIDILRRFAHYIFVVVAIGDESPGLASVQKELRNFAPLMAADL